MSNNLDENPFGEPFDDPFKVRCRWKFICFDEEVQTY